MGEYVTAAWSQVFVDTVDRTALVAGWLSSLLLSSKSATSAPVLAY